MSPTGREAQTDYQVAGVYEDDKLGHSGGDLVEIVLMFDIDPKLCREIARNVEGEAKHRNFLFIILRNLTKNYEYYSMGWLG